MNLDEIDMVNSPPHYAAASTAIEPIDILRYAPFDLGNCLKYILRAGYKSNAVEDLKKAEYYLICAEDTYIFNPEPYEGFMKNYGFLLSKFERLTLITQDGWPGFLHEKIDTLQKSFC